ncbi:MAG: YdeI/OmpD-associated family protein [Spirosomataceae bacterium]
MAQAGLACVEIAKQNGAWEILDSVEALIIPEDLGKALITKANAMDFFMSLSKSVRKAMLQWVILAKRPETRQKRITEIAELAAKAIKPKQF